MSLDDACDISGIGAEWDNDWHIAALFIIIGTSALGVFLPIISQTTRGLGSGLGVPVFAIQLGQFFGSGVIISTAFIHLFPAAYSALTNPCLGAFSDRYGAWASLIAMATVFTMHSVEWWLVEAWLSRTGHSTQGSRISRRRHRRQLTGADHDDNSSEGEGDSMLFPVYSRAFNASRMMLPPPVVSPPVHPFVFGTSTMSPASRHVGAQTASAFASRTGFALSKYGNYAAVVQSRQHLAMMQNDQVSRYLYSDPQFPLYAPPATSVPCWPMPPQPYSGLYDSSQHSRRLGMRGSAQAKSTPELMRKYPKSIRISNNSLEPPASDKHTSVSSNAAISLRPNSFSNQVKRTLGSHRTRRTDIESGIAGMGWRHRCLSMPRLPPTTLDAGMCESLLDPAPLPQALPYRGRRRSNCTSASGISPQSITAALSARRRSLQGSAHHRRGNGSTGSINSSALGARSSLGDAYELASPNTGRLDTVPETDDAWTAPMPPNAPEGDEARKEAVSPSDGRMHTYATTVSGGYATAVTSGRPPSGLLSSRQNTQASGRTQKRVSINTPPLPAASAFASVNTGLPPSRNSSHGHAPPARAPLPLPLHQGGSLGQGAEYGNADDDDQDSTAIHSKRSSATGLTYPVEVKRRALATYVLELGIALYSVLMGLALAISDRGFIALFLAVCFHQFFEGLALGTSLAELYWVKAQIAAQFRASVLHAIESESMLAMPEGHLAERGEAHHKISLSSAAMAMNSEHPSSSYHMVNVNVVGSTTFSSNAEFSPTKKPPKRQSAQITDDDLSSGDFEYCSPNRDNINKNRHSKSRRTLASMATSFTPEPWQVNPQLEKTLGTGAAAGTGTVPNLSTHSTTNKQHKPGDKHDLEVEHRRRYLQPRSAPERLPGWWKAWLSALAFTMTTPTGIVIGLAIRHVYEPQSSYALLFNGILQSICTGVLVYAGLVTLMIGGFNSAQVKRLPRLLQTLLFFAVYAGAAVMASLKIWK
ncbi:hypothetical protein IWW37_002631 [Coemansia sp. RSA 2050]|nr:hypothetical protein IWW37_002631 [Coemansia sp. RSA 2050]KAJ2733581.1 hypothetical protein IW152_002951 [Coemansia sp. BCRC 34962]